jgi:hypothetical protein
MLGIVENHFWTGASDTHISGFRRTLSAIIDRDELDVKEMFRNKIIGLLKKTVAYQAHSKIINLILPKNRFIQVEEVIEDLVDDKIETRAMRRKRIGESSQQDLEKIQSYQREGEYGLVDLYSGMEIPSDDKEIYLVDLDRIGGNFVGTDIPSEDDDDAMDDTYSGYTSELVLMTDIPSDDENME